MPCSTSEAADCVRNGVSFSSASINYKAQTVWKWFYHDLSVVLSSIYGSYIDFCRCLSHFIRGGRVCGEFLGLPHGEIISHKCWVMASRQPHVAAEDQPGVYGADRAGWPLSLFQKPINTSPNLHCARARPVFDSYSHLFAPVRADWHHHHHK